MFIAALSSKTHTHTLQKDGRCPFHADEEAAILVVLRRKQPWPCFVGIPALSHLGKQFRSRGYHEKLQQPPPPAQRSVQTEDNINELVALLKPEDAQYLTELGGHVVSHSAFTATFTLEDQCKVYDLLRYAILGRTLRCYKDVPYSHAESLCFESFDAMIMVLDMTAKTYATCVLAQNLTSRTRVGDLVGNCNQNLMWHSELLRVIIAIGGAYHQPQVEFIVRRQKTVCIGTVKLVCFDTTYCVDPDSYFLVVTGVESV